MILLLALGCAYPDFLGDTDPSDTDPSDTDTDPVDTDVPTPCGEEPVPTSAVERESADATGIGEAFEVAPGGPGELVVLRTERVVRVRFSGRTPTPHGEFTREGSIDPQADRLGGPGDLDGDGELDLPILRSGSPCVVHLHAFTGQTPQSVTVGTSAVTCAIVPDVTGDDQDDLVVADLQVDGGARGFSVWDGQALTSGSTTPWGTWVLTELQFGPLGASQVADLELDGLDELVFATGGEEAGDAPAIATIPLEPTPTPRTVDTALLRSANQGDQSEASLALGDWDGDGDLDPAGAFWHSPEGPGAVLGHGVEATTIDPQQALFRWIEDAPTALGASAAGVGDFDGGGCDDLAMTLGTQVAVYSGTSLRGDLATVTPAFRLTATGADLLGRGLVAPGDLDGDGAPDLVALGELGGGVLVGWVFFGGAR